MRRVAVPGVGHGSGQRVSEAQLGQGAAQFSVSAGAGNGRERGWREEVRAVWVIFVRAYGAAERGFRRASVRLPQPVEATATLLSMSNNGARACGSGRGRRSRSSRRAKGERGVVCAQGVRPKGSDPG